MRLRDICRVNPKVPEWDRISDYEPVPFLPMERVWTDRLDLSELRPKEEVASGYTRFAEGDLLLPKITPTFEAGRAAIAEGLPHGIGVGTTELHVLRLNGRAHPRWLLHFLNQETFLRRGHSDMYGVAGQKRISDEFVKSYPVDLPPIEEQQRIADYLDAETARIDDLVHEQQRLVRLNRERFESWREGLLTGAPDVTYIPLARLTDPARPIVYGIVQAGPNVPDGVPYIKTGDLERLEPDLLSRTTREIDEVYRRSKVVPGDLVIAMRASIGAVVAIPETIPAANLTQGTARIAPAKGVCAAWLLHALRTQFVQDEAVVRAVGSTFRTLNIADLRRLPIPYVPGEAQRELAERLDEGEAKLLDLERELNAQIDLLQEHRQALITHAVTQGLDGLPGVA